VYDVAVDLRIGSPTYLQWHGYELDAGVQREVYIPAGFAHGFQALEDAVELLYLHGARWSPAHEGTLRFDDPRLSIAWPLPVTQISDKDRQAPLIGDDFRGISP
jgi:dTDP-4-dehydrorhamnose 3,5-epimerase